MATPTPRPLGLPALAAVVDGVLETAQELLQLELVALNRLRGPDVLTARTVGALPGLTPGVRVLRPDVLCDAVLGGEPLTTADAQHDPRTSGSRSVEALGLQTYVGVPVRDERGEVVASLCGLDRRSVQVPAPAVEVLQGLAGVLTAHVDRLPELDAALARTDGLWRVQGVRAEDNPYALVALLTEDPLPDPVQEEAWLRAQLAVLEVTLQERVVVEQAVGVLAERLSVSPASAFAALRQHADPSGGVVTAARAVVAGAAA